MFRRIRLIVVLSLSVIVEFCAVACMAANAVDANVVNSLPVNVRKTRMNTKTKKTPRNEEEFSHTVLQSAVSLPNLPNYTGQSKFLAGTIAQHARGGTYYIEKFSVREAAGAVMAWYDVALKMNKWNVDSGSQSSLSLSATDQLGDTCEVITAPPTTPGYKADLIIQFKMKQ